MQYLSDTLSRKDQCSTAHPCQPRSCRQPNEKKINADRMVINNHNQCSEIRQGNFWGLIFCRGSFYGFVGSPHAKRNVVNHLIFQSEFPVFPYKWSGTPDLWTLSFSSVMSCVLYARSRYICLDLVNGVWIKIIYILYIYIYKYLYSGQNVFRRQVL